MRHGNSRNSINPNSFIELRSYLWGMETHDDHSDAYLQARYSDPTYEAWKQQDDELDLQKLDMTPILPMRHGNHNFTGVLINPDGYSDPTYEAWKRVRHKKVHSRYCHSDPTYEAWKQRRCEYVCQGRIDSDPTYEAWKPEPEPKAGPHCK